MRYTIKLSKEQIDRATTIAKIRNEGKENLKTTRRWGTNQNVFNGNVQSAKAEIAIANLLNGTINEKKLHKGDGKKGDVTLPNGRTISVKYAKKIGCPFALTSNDINEFKDDYGIVVYPGKEENTLIVAGFISKEKFKEIFTIENYGYGDRLVAKEEFLEDINGIRTNSGRTTRVNGE